MFSWIHPQPPSVRTDTELVYFKAGGRCVSYVTDWFSLSLVWTCSAEFRTKHTLAEVKRTKNKKDSCEPVDVRICPVRRTKPPVQKAHSLLAELLHVFTLPPCSNVGRPASRRQRVEEVMHLAVVACGDRLDETLTMVKSALLFSLKRIFLHIFAEDPLAPQFKERVRSLFFFVFF